MAEFEKERIALNIDGIALNVSMIHRRVAEPFILFLHGFGSTKEDYADIVRQPALGHFSFVAYDAPGCGETVCSNLEAVSIPFLMKTAVSILDRLNIQQCHLVGHSMGGLTALMLADSHPERFLSFTNIEGNIAPEDCFLSRQIISYPAATPDEFFEQFIQRTLHAPAYSSPLYSASLRHKVRAHAVPSIFKSMVHLSDHGDLMARFLNLPFPKMFMYGAQNRTLSYLSHIEKNGVKLAEIPQCGHFPMYANPPAMWREMVAFLNEKGGKSGDASSS